MMLMAAFIHRFLESVVKYIVCACVRACAHVCIMELIMQVYHACCVSLSHKLLCRHAHS